MNVTFVKTGDLTANLTVSVVEADYREQVNKDLKKFGREHALPGFRKGHVPFGELRRRFGKEMTSDVLNRIVYEATINYLRENKINVLGEPLPTDVKELDLDHQVDFDFTYELGLAPEFNFEINKEVHVPFYTIAVTDEMVDEQDKSLRKRFGAQVPGEEMESDALVKGVLMELNEDGTVKEGEDAIQVIDGIVGPMFFKSKEEAAKFDGKKVGDKVVFNPWNSCEGSLTEMASMLHIDKARAENVKSNFEFAISEIIVVRPAELGDEFYTNVFGADKVHNEEEYKAALKEMIAAELAPNSHHLFAAAARKQLMSLYGNFELPDAFLIKWVSAKNPDADPEAVAADYEKDKEALRWQLLSSSIADKLGVKIVEEDMLAYAKMIAARQFAQYGMTNLDEDTVTKYARQILEDQKYRAHIYDQVSEGKFFSTLADAVTTDNEEVSLDKFKEIAAQY